MGAYFYSYINTAQTILSSYKFEQPFHVHLKFFFKKNKKYGSRDRKLISNLCYGFFRIGDAAASLSFQEQIIIGYFLTHDFDNGFLSILKSEWVDQVQHPIKEKLGLVGIAYPLFNQQLLFPGIEYLSGEINREEFQVHHFLQPDFFIRVRPGQKKIVERKFTQHQLPYKEISATAFKIAAGVDINAVIATDKEAVVQDISSQATSEFFPSFTSIKPAVWDACAGSGGKSIMAVDFYKDLQLYVSDIRQDILEELSRRFQIASIEPASIFCTDLQQSLSKQVVTSRLPAEGVDLIIADVPCTGSGTWGRSPEWLKGFDLTLIEEYKNRQFAIVSNLPAHLKNGGYLLYITCSVYAQENEEVVARIQEMSPLTLVKRNVVHQSGGDYLFAALFQKN